jgi:hypothetical protein
MTASAQAAVTFAYTTPVTNVLATPNTTIEVPIYLQETGSPSQIAAEGGLFSGAFSVTRSGVIPPSPVSVSGAATNATKFNEVVGSFTTTPTAAGVWAEQAGALMNTGAFPENGLILLGTVSLQVPLAGQTTTFSIGDFDPRTGQIVTYNGSQALDSQIANGTFTVSGSSLIPEPTILGLAGLGCLLLKRSRRYGQSA